MRKKYKPDLKAIKKMYGGTRKDRKHASYTLNFKEQLYDLEINEFGYYYFHPFNNYKIRDSKNLSAVKEMIAELELFLKDN